MELVICNNGSSIIQIEAVDIKHLLVCFIFDVVSSLFCLDEGPSLMVSVC